MTFTILVFKNYSQNQFTISPSIKTGNKYYIFGYGSLINEESRKQTGITGKAIPVRVHHMQEVGFMMLIPSIIQNYQIHHTQLLEQLLI